MSVSRQLHKFGGSSLANPECYQRVVDILTQYSQSEDLIIVSAAGKTTNQLFDFLAALDAAFASNITDIHNNDVVVQKRQLLYQFQSSLITDLLHSNSARVLLTLLDEEFAAFQQLTLPLSEAQRAAVLGHGEMWSARLLAALLNQHQLAAIAIDARTFLRAEAGAQPEVDRSQSWPLIKAVLAQHPRCRCVITGFMAANEKGETVLLGRNGSDYSATVIGALADVSTVTIWSDVAGVYSADPRLVNDACLLPLLRLDEASELAHLAAPVLHSRTLQPISQSEIDLNLRCSYQPESGSTRIERVLASGRGAKIITSLEDVRLLKLTFTSEQDLTYWQQQILQLLKRRQLEPLAYKAQPDKKTLILAYTAELAGGVQQLLQQKLQQEQADLYNNIEQQQGYSLVAAVGSGVTTNPKHCHGFYQQLIHLPVEFVFESESGLSLVAVLRTIETNLLVKGLHNRLFQAQKRVAIALCGKGNIGSSWLTLFAERKAELEKRRGINFSLVAVVTSNTYWFDHNGIAAASVKSQYARYAQPYDSQEWLESLSSLNSYDEVVVIDLTASEALANRYLRIAELGFHLISANKIAGSGSSEHYYQIQDAFDKTSRHWLYNATVGAGLPVNHTVRDLRESGDQVIALAGIFSGTLSWLFQQFDGSIPFSELVDLAWQQGLTEPDPRSDLDGSDVMRKLVILARESGLELEPENVNVESLVPEALMDLSLDDFFNQASLLNDLLAERLLKAQRQNKVLRYVARLDKNGHATVGVELLNSDHALANLLPCDNIFAIESKWYKENPLVIRGPGAGRDVTAGAIQSDLNRLSQLF